MFCASLEGWTKQGNSYFGAHVRYALCDGSSEEKETKGKTNLTLAAMIRRKKRTGERGFGRKMGWMCEGEAQGVWGGFPHSPRNRVWRKLTRMVSAFCQAGRQIHRVS